jgi:hypothetical protein
MLLNRRYPGWCREIVEKYLFFIFSHCWNGSAAKSWEGQYKFQRKRVGPEDRPTRFRNSEQIQNRSHRLHNRTAATNQTVEPKPPILEAHFSCQTIATIQFLARRVLNRTRCASRSDRRTFFVLLQSIRASRRIAALHLRPATAGSLFELCAFSVGE